MSDTLRGLWHSLKGFYSWYYHDSSRKEQQQQLSIKASPGGGGDERRSSLDSSVSWSLATFSLKQSVSYSLMSMTQCLIIHIKFVSGLVARRII